MIELGCGRIETRRKEMSSESGLTKSADTNKKCKGKVGG